MSASFPKRKKLQKEDSDEETSDVENFDEENSDIEKSDEENSDETSDEEDSDTENEDSDVFNPPGIYFVHEEPEIEDSDDAKQLKRNLLNVLTRIQKEKTSEFAVGRSAELPTSPGIKISGYGTVSLPVTERTVKDLRKHFHQAPYGLGEDTLIDKAVRDSWQLDPEKFLITNPKFNSGVEKLVKEIQSELDCSDKVTLHLYKLLLYEPGGHFKPHRDTEKHPGMFATLIIQVPSIFTGGDLVVKHGAREKKIAFGTPQSEFSCTYAAHYADCEHELTEITSGYRMALVYSLCWDGNGVVPSPPDIPVNKLAGLLEQIDQVLPDPCLIAWGLDHHYSEKSLLEKGVQALKGSDKLIYSTMQGANAILEEDKKLDFFIVQAKRIDNMYGSCTMEYDGWGGYPRRKCGSGDCFENNGDCETEYKFKVVGTDGKSSKYPVNFRVNEKKYVLNVGEDDDEFWGKCDEGECSGPSGNEGASKTNWYRRYVLFIFPKENAFKVLFKNDVGPAIEYLTKQMKSEDVSSSSVIKLANDVVELCVKLKQRFCENKKSVITMLKLISRMKELEFAKMILSLLSEPLVNYRYSTESMDVWHRHQWEGAFGIPSEEMISVLEDLISAFGWKKLSDPLSRLIESCPPIYYKHAVAFLQQCPDDVPKKKLLASMVKKAVTSGESEGKLTDESLLVIGGVILNHPKSCSQFVKPFLDLPRLQNVQMLTKLLSFLTKIDTDIKENKLYQMTFAKFSEKILSHGGISSTSGLEVHDIVKCAEFLVRMQENTLLEKLVEDVLQNPNAYLLENLLSILGQSADVSESFKRPYQMTLAKFSEQLHKLSHGGSETAVEVDAIVKGAEFLLELEENTLFEKLVEDVLQNPNVDLLKKLLASSLGQSANISEPVKRLIVARINQLLPNVQSGAPKLSWCQPEAVIPGHPEVQAFLQGPERRFVYRRFTGKVQATKFERDYFKGRGNAVIKVIGCRSDTVVEITKIPAKAKHQEAVWKYNKDCEELKSLQAKLG